MDKFHFNLFDIFGNVIPGSLTLYSIYFLLSKESALLICKKSELVKIDSLESWIIIIVISYLIGYIQQYFSHRFFKLIKVVLGKSESFILIGQNLSRVREESTANYILIQRFMMLRILGYNMAFATIINLLAFLASSYYIDYSLSEWSILVLLSLFASIFFILRALDFDNYAHVILEDTIKYLN